MTLFVFFVMAQVALYQNNDCDEECKPWKIVIIVYISGFYTLFAGIPLFIWSLKCTDQLHEEEEELVH